ncbi:DNA-directed RNA polymerase subunit beta' [Plakobranchus ocellatus]|uniref:DNA-directed RNA polymerase subunit beta n=1 Tax=Plakobranchus ocellatus TaxID=259542 RepID=A0AAV4AXM3_9GAST|nr:DNA-directed RNA polymerase subunit beta' [Plakobranchus ocellatus]
MLRKVEVVDPGDGEHVKGEIVDKYKIRKENKAVAEEGGQPATVRSVLLGLTKASLNTESFISSAAFQETTKILTNAAIKNSTDDLRGLKENVIIGQKIPAGTGNEYYEDVNIYKEIPGDLDYLFGKV